MHRQILHVVRLRATHWLSVLCGQSIRQDWLTTVGRCQIN
jgi:hypothetical protein